VPGSPDRCSCCSSGQKVHRPDRLPQGWSRLQAAKSGAGPVPRQGNAKRDNDQAGSKRVGMVLACRIGSRGPQPHMFTVLSAQMTAPNQDMPPHLGCSGCSCGKQTHLLLLLQQQQLLLLKTRRVAWCASCQHLPATNCCCRQLGLRLLCGASAIL